MFSCVGGFINLILHCRTTARADTATPPWLGFSFCVCSKALPDMQINTITGTNKDDRWEEGRDGEGGMEGQRIKEREGKRKGESHPWPIPASFHAQPLLVPRASSTISSFCLSSLALSLSSSLNSLPSNDSPSVVLLCPCSWQNSSRDTKFPGRGGRQLLPSAHPQVRCAGKHGGKRLDVIYPQA